MNAHERFLSRIVGRQLHFADHDMSIRAMGHAPAMPVAHNALGHFEGERLGRLQLAGVTVLQQAQVRFLQCILCFGAIAQPNWRRLR